MLCFFSLFFCAGALVLLSNATTSNMSFSVSPSLRCGEIFKCAQGTFQYKSTDTSNRAERCVWLLAVPGAVKYAIQLEYPTNNWSSGLNLNSYKNSGLLVTPIFGNNDTLVSTPLFSTEVPTLFVANLVVVTYYSEPYEPNILQEGFIITFQAEQNLQERAHIISTYSEYSFWFPDNSLIRHPASLRPPINHIVGSVELSLIGLIPRDNYSDSSRKVKILYNRVSEGEDIDCVFQSINIFSFKKDAEFLGFRFKGTFCDDVSSLGLVTTDLSFITVLSLRNTSDVKRGFTITFVD